jgi:hypothetical protein
VVEFSEKILEADRFGGIDLRAVTKGDAIPVRENSTSSFRPEALVKCITS